MSVREWWLSGIVLALVMGVGVACSSTRVPADSTLLVTLTSTALILETITETPSPTMRVGDPVLDQSLWALVDGNDLAADRINLVFAPWGWDDNREFSALVGGSLSWDGNAYIFDDDGDVTDQEEFGAGAALGLFAIEPWRSSTDLFNVWYTNLEPPTPVSWLDSQNQPFLLDDVVVVTVAVDAYRFNPDLTSVAGFDGSFVGPAVPHRPASGQPFAHAVVLVESGFPVGGLVDVPHELGHGMFNLPDEYVGERLGFDGRSDLSSWPSCAQDLAEADAWWGDLIDEVDPMLNVWIDEMNEAGFPLNVDSDFSETQIEVGFVDGGCYGVSGSVRATIDSLMNTSLPVLGSVNRRWAEEVLQLWDGRPRT